MKTTALLFSLFLSISVFASDDNSHIVEQDGLIVEVVDFEEGDKLKLFEAETGDHILSKSYSSIDLSQLPLGSYILENNQGKSVIIDRMEEELIIEGAVVIAGESYLSDEGREENYPIEEVAINEEVNVEQEFVQSYVDSQKNLLSIKREGDIITVVDFEEGDKLKLFEVKDTIHVLSKTTNVIDMSQLPVGVYMLENNNGDSVVVEKYLDIEYEENLAEM
ncbi:hypothetical protein [Aquimarina mytili]|uniref:Por secretion system C-terminal sorting domain-containing protein n=1 Tax=Aquimarina mytili TaxID=874423 RepID=A0A936ZZP7_9FLAO|nr:hypothetical protein [Aquimarina mytili]MBL0684938.1 hypothetical protein [Aquimarina mytili]